ncbi:MAG: hypothetical protein MJA29_06600 [Candidatus Omnitrophica bacterium]|nr:hypothetical protein [Candidatus Omnitrophota bacterium]
MKRYVMPGVILSFLFVISSCAQQPDMASEMYTSTEPQLSFSLDYPAGWKHSEQRGSTEEFFQVVFYPAADAGVSGKPTLVITALPVDVQENKDLTGFLKNLLKKRSGFKDFAYLAEPEVIASGKKLPCALIVYSRLIHPKKQGTERIKEQLVALRRNSYFFVIRYENTEPAFAAHRDILEKAVSSFVFGG